MKYFFKRAYILVLIITLVFGTINIASVNVKADKYVPALYAKDINNNDIKYTFKDGTLIAEGKGYADKSYSCRKKDIKKIVIKKGIKGIADYAFSDCRNIKSISVPTSLTDIGFYAFSNSNLPTLILPKTLKRIGATSFNTNKPFSITMPGNFKLVWNSYLEEDERYISYGFKKIKLNSPYNPTNKVQFASDSIYTMKNDPKYKSYKGTVYTKNGKTLVQVPAHTKHVKIRKGCTRVLESSLLYFNTTEEDGNVTFLDPKTVYISKTVKKIVNDIKEYGINFDSKVKWTIKTKKLDGRSIEILCALMSNSQEKKFLNSPNSRTIKKYSGMVITKDGILIKYTGKRKTLKLPSIVKRVGFNAVSSNKLKRLVLNKKLKNIGVAAFNGCNHLKTIVWNKKLKKVEDDAFSDCDFKTVKITSSVRKWGSYVFAYNKSTKIIIPKKMKKIPEGMFIGNRVKNLVIPKTVNEIGNDSFADAKNKTITIKNGVKKIGRGAFFGGDYTIKKVVIPKSVKQIGDYAFNMSVIKKLIIKNTSIKIGENALYSVGLMDVGNDPAKYFTYTYLSSMGTRFYQIAFFKVKGASGMEIEVSQKPNYSNPVVKRTVTNETGYVEIKTPEEGFKYLRIRVYTIKKNKKVYGPWKLISVL